ncbi:MAG TPA: ankyrin repeat domain-containing protein [Kofleriaceae bacterium]|nr:ankyrin repeat domain-containing protein [Kofleriaceae bacterium]
MPIEPLPSRPSLEHLRKQAKRLLRAVRDRNPDALAQVAEHHPRGAAAATAFALHDAQLVIARRHGFASWPRLTRHLAAIAPHAWDPRAARDVESWIAHAVLDYDRWRPADLDRARAALAASPALASADVHAAATAGDVAALRALLDDDRSRANVRGGPYHWPPLLYACYSRLALPGHSAVDAARLLLAAGADPDAGFLWCGHLPPFTALTGAFGEGEDPRNQPPHPERDALARALLDAGADPNDGQTLYNRHFRDDDSHLELLFAYGLGRDRGGPWLRAFGDRIGTPTDLLVEELWAAAKNGYLSRVRLLVERGTPIDQPGRRDGLTAYETALRAGHRDIADYLAAHGAHARPLSAREAFALACLSADRDAVRALLDRHPELLAQLGPGERAELVWRATRARRPDAIQLLADLGFALDVYHVGRTPLHEAAWAGDAEMIARLLALGADPTLRDSSHHATPLGWAVHNAQPAAVAVLAPHATIFDAIGCDLVAVARTLLAANPALAAAHDSDGDPVTCYLHDRLEHLADLIDMLRDAGADFTARDHHGRTLREVLRARGDQRTLSALDDAGVNAGDEPAAR